MVSFLIWFCYFSESSCYLVCIRFDKRWILADWVVCEILALNQGSLAGVRYILKDTIKYMPIFGWYFPQHNCVYVRRTGTPKDIEDIERQLQVYPRLQMPVWLVIFPEGTRYNPDKPKVVQKSQQFAHKLS